METIRWYNTQYNNLLMNLTVKRFNAESSWKNIYSHRLSLQKDSTMDGQHGPNTDLYLYNPTTFVYIYQMQL